MFRVSLRPSDVLISVSHLTQVNLIYYGAVMYLIKVTLYLTYHVVKLP